MLDKYLVIVIISVLIILVLSIFIISSKGYKSKHFNNKIYKVIKKYENKGFKIYRNCSIPLIGGKNQKIDLVLVSEYGVFVINSIYIIGTVLSKEKDDIWTISIKKKKKTIEKNIPNPISENYYVVENFKRFLGSNVEINSLFVINKEAKFKYNIRNYVTNNKIKKHINSLIKEKKEKINCFEIEYINKNMEETINKKK